MITVIHGDDIVSSRKLLSSEKQKLKSFVSFDVENLTLTELVQNIEGKGLFANKTAIFIENFLSKKSKISEEVKEIVNFLNRHVNDAEIFFWEGKEISKASLKIFPNSINKLFKFPQKLFLFLDSIRPNAGKQIISLFHQTLENVEVELIFFMLVRQFRLLLALSDNKTDKTIDEVSRLAPWQVGKLSRQSSMFTQDKLKKIYGRLSEIDVLQKTGGLNMGLSQTIDFLLLEI